jgi:hypothetical protein
VPAAPVSRPASIDLAVKLMKVGAAFSLISLLSVFFLRSQLEDAARDAIANSNGAIKPDALDSLVNVGIITAVIFGLLGVGLWLWMASANGQGKSWARILSSVFFALSTLSFVMGLSQPSAMLSRLVSALMWLLSAYIIFLLYKRESSDYYAAMSRPKI